eukprot:3905822-Pleurochrysis_carterae.AAC.2
MLRAQEIGHPQERPFDATRALTWALVQWMRPAPTSEGHGWALMTLCPSKTRPRGTKRCPCRCAAGADTARGGVTLFAHTCKECSACVYAMLKFCGARVLAHVSGTPASVLAAYTSVCSNEQLACICKQATNTSMLIKRLQP